jgi:molecular chaperone HscB
MNYFALLGIEPSFIIDITELEQAYFREQRKFHPDRFIGKSAEERNAALNASMDINHAYETLKTPIKRAQYLLHLQGITVGTEKDSVKPSQAQLIEIMELREDLETGKKIPLDTMIAASENSIAEYYSAKNFDAMAQETLRLGYLIKIKSDNH